MCIADPLVDCPGYLDILGGNSGQVGHRDLGVITATPTAAIDNLTQFHHRIECCHPGAQGPEHFPAALALLPRVNGDQAGGGQYGGCKLLLVGGIHATGSAGTQAGLVTGLRATHAHIPVLGIGVNAAREAQEEKVYKLALETADFIGAGGCVRREDVVANCDYVGDGYGIATAGMREALLQLARLEGLLFDPVYSGKGLAGMIDLVEKGEFKTGQNIVFIHTGGSAGLFGYLEEIL
jgi:hypothetical protein